MELCKIELKKTPAFPRSKLVTVLAMANTSIYEMFYASNQ